MISTKKVANLPTRPTSIVRIAHVLLVHPAVVARAAVTTVVVVAPVAVVVDLVAVVVDLVAAAGAKIAVIIGKRAVATKQSAFLFLGNASSIVFVLSA